MVSKTAMMGKTQEKSSLRTMRRRKKSSSSIVEDLEKTVTDLNAEKMNLLLRNEHLRHELYILRRKYERLLDELQ